MLAARWGQRALPFRIWATPTGCPAPQERTWIQWGARFSIRRMTAVAAPVSKQPSPLLQPVTVLYSVGPERATLLKRLEIVTVEDLLLHRPARYEDRRQLRAITDLQPHELGVTRGTIVALGVKWFARHTKSIF